MPRSLADYFGISQKILDDFGVYNTIIDADSRFFINFSRLKDTNAEELKLAYTKVLEVFRKMALLLKHSKKPGDLFYIKSFRMLEMSEFEEICLGYAFDSTSGSGSGEELKNRILKTAKEIIDAGIEEPEIFELVGLFNDKIGPDRLSDMIGHLIKDDLITFTKRIFKEIKDLADLNADVIVANDLPINPCNGKYIIFLSKDILHELPIAEEWDDIDTVCAMNQEIRERINQAIGTDWKKYTAADKKSYMRKLLISEPDLITKLIHDYRKFHLDEYDYVKDPLGEATWYPVSHEYVKKHPLTLPKSDITNDDQLRSLVLQIIHHFKQLIEFNGLNEILYSETNKPRHERIAQKCFYAVSSAYCIANNLDINPEVNSGRGPVDFKFSFGNNLKVLVEVKLTSNTQLKKGYLIQLQEYEKSERTENGFYLIIDNGASEKLLNEILAIHNSYVAKHIKTRELIIINGNLKPSASKMPLFDGHL